MYKAFLHYLADRTSMELPYNERSFTFNRTSMELKLFRKQTDAV